MITSTYQVLVLLVLRRWESRLAMEEGNHLMCLKIQIYVMLDPMLGFVDPPVVVLEWTALSGGYLVGNCPEEVGCPWVPSVP
jgi:hypothetical protein